MTSIIVQTGSIPLRLKASMTFRRFASFCRFATDPVLRISALISLCISSRLISSSISLTASAPIPALNSDPYSSSASWY